MFSSRSPGSRLLQLLATKCPTTSGASSIERLCDADLLDFIPRLTPQWERPDHLAPIAALFERIARGEPVFALVSVPPQHGKTELVLHGLAREMARRPAMRHAYVSYGSQYALTRSRALRLYAKRAGVSLQRGSNSVSEWQTVQGGGLIAKSIGGDLTGRPVDGIFVLDDPHKDRVEAESAHKRQLIREWWTSTARPRIHPGASIIIIHTRWHEDDTIGWLSKEKKLDDLGEEIEGAREYEVINLPAINDNGEALWPKRRPLKFLHKARKANDYDWHSLYMGAPRPRGGHVFRGTHLYNPKKLPTFGYRLAIGVDLAYTIKKRSDMSVAVVLLEAGGFVYVLEVIRRRVEAPVFAEELRALAAKYPGAPMAMYASGVEVGVNDFMRRDGVPIQDSPAVADKFVRAQPTAARWNKGEILLPDATEDEPPPEWRSEFSSVVLGFTGVGDVHDDDVDALAAGVDVLSGQLPIEDLPEDPSNEYRFATQRGY